MARKPKKVRSVTRAGKIKKAAKAKKVAKAKKTKRVAKAAKGARSNKVNATGKPLRAKPAKKVAKAKPVKKVTAAKPAPKPASRIAPPRIEQGRSILVAGLGGWYDAQTMRDIPSVWQRLAAEFLGRVPQQTNHKVYYGLCSNMDGRGGLNYYAAFEVLDPSGLPSDLTVKEIAARPYAVFTHSGHVRDIGQTWMAIFDEGLPQAKLEMATAPAFELYHDDRFDPRTGEGEIEIWIPLSG